LSHDLRLERVNGAPPQAVFDAFTDPDAQKELYAESPDWAVEASCDLRVGGRWTISFGPPGGPAALETNVFQVVDRPRRLFFSSTMRMPDGSSIETDIQVTFEEEDRETRMTLVQRGFPAAQVRDDFTSGWGTILDRLGRLAATRSAG
jgi:uncharacterized protein YndB with AHSA1/START domain